MGTDDWGLEAVVRGCCLAAAAEVDDQDLSSYDLSVTSMSFMENESAEFPDPMATRTVVHELEELLNPFFPNTIHQSASSSSSASSNSLLTPVMGVRQLQHPTLPHRPLPVYQISRSKRRKSQQKRVVSHVPADGASPDMWAWRKYGQKPIKGSPFPRGYYRCSSSKGCMARKMVERSRTDPSLLIITYTAEHNHPAPAHRNSLAGSTRPRLHPPTSATNSGGAAAGPPSPTSSAGLSPTTPLSVPVDEELLQKGGNGDGEEEGGDEYLEGGGGGEMLLVDCNDGTNYDDECLLIKRWEGVSYTASTSMAGPTDAVSVTTTFSPSTWLNHNAPTAAGSS